MIERMSKHNRKKVEGKKDNQKNEKKTRYMERKSGKKKVELKKKTKQNKGRAGEANTSHLVEVVVRA